LEGLAGLVARRNSHVRLLRLGPGGAVVRSPMAFASDALALIIFHDLP
jgi:hypothetical protein